MPEFYLLGGPNGAGKSTIADKFYAEKAIIINGDRFVRQFKLQSKIDAVPIDVYRQINNLIIEAFKSRKDLLIESNLITPGSYREYLTLATDHGYETNLVFIAIDELRELNRRIDKRVKLRSEHFVPEETVKENYKACMMYLPQFLNKFNNTSYLILHL